VTRRNGEGARSGRLRESQLTAANRPLEASTTPRQTTTRLQDVFLRLAEDIDAIESLPGRERAVLIDLTARRLRRTVETNRALLQEWGLVA
jgi:hypothetical protein